MNPYTLVAYLLDLRRNARVNIDFCKDNDNPNAHKGWKRLGKEFERQEQQYTQLIEELKNALTRTD